MGGCARYHFFFLSYIPYIYQRREWGRCYAFPVPTIDTKGDAHMAPTVSQMYETLDTDGNIALQRSSIITSVSSESESSIDESGVVATHANCVGALEIPANRLTVLQYENFTANTPFIRYGAKGVFTYIGDTEQLFNVTVKQRYVRKNTTVPDSLTTYGITTTIMASRANPVIATEAYEVMPSGVPWVEVYVTKTMMLKNGDTFSVRAISALDTLTYATTDDATSPVENVCTLDIYAITQVEGQQGSQDSTSSTSDMYRPINIPASTVFPGSTLTDTTITENIDLRGEVITSISHDYTDSSIHSAPSSKALFDSIQKLDTAIRAIDPNNNFFTDNTVVTLPLLPTSFSLDDDRWLIFNWYIDQGSAIYTKAQSTRMLMSEYDNYIKIRQDLLTYPGYYFFVITVSRIDSGKLVLRDTIGNIIYEIKDIGTHYFEYQVTNTDVTTFALEAVNVYDNETIKVDSIGFYHITDRVRHYLLYFMQGSASGYITREQLNTILKMLQSDIEDDYLHHIEVLRSALDEHVNNRSNPHGVMYYHTGAAPEVHEHPQYALKSDLDDIRDGIDVNLGDLSNLIGSLQDKDNDLQRQITEVAADLESTKLDIDDLGKRLDAHLEEENPHGITVDMIGAAPEVHEHPQYATLTSVEAIVDAKLEEFDFSDIPAASSGAAYNPMSIVAFDQLGEVPNGLNSSIITKPISPIIFPYILHRSKSQYDWNDGVCGSNKPTLDGYPIWYAFNKNLTEDDINIGTSVFAIADVTSDDPLLLEYVFHVKRTINGFNLIKSTLKPEFCGLPTRCSVYVDGAPVRLDQELTFSGDVAMVTFDTAYTGRKWDIFITAVDSVGCEYFGCKIVFRFDDVPVGCVGLLPGLDYVRDKNIEHVGTMQTLAISPDSDRTPKYLFLRTKEEESGGGTTYEPVILPSTPMEVDVKYLPDGTDPDPAMLTQTETIMVDFNFTYGSVSIGGLELTADSTGVINPSGYTLPLTVSTAYGELAITDIAKNDLNINVITVSYTLQSKPDIADDTELVADDVSVLFNGTAQESLAIRIRMREADASTRSVIATYDSSNIRVAEEPGLEVSIFPYEYGTVREGLDLLMGAYAAHPTRGFSMWGTPEASVESMDEGVSVETIYTYTDDSYVVEGNTLTITHTFDVPVTITNVNMMFFRNLVELGAIPDTIRLDVHGGEEEPVTAINITNFVPVLSDVNDTQIWYHTHLDTPIENTTKMVLVLTNTKNAKVGITRLVPLISSKFYNLNTRKMSSDSDGLFPLGRLDYVEAYDGTWSGYAHSGVVLGTYSILPVDGLSMQTNDATIHTLPNPYGTPLIRTTPLSYGDNPFMNMDVVDITRDTITVRTRASGRYLLGIQRAW